MKKILVGFFLIIGFSFITGCNNSSKSCYDTEEEAWQACNNKYNGKCKFLGPNYKVCSNPNIVETKSIQPIAYIADCTVKWDDDPDGNPINLEITVNNNTVREGAGLIAYFTEKSGDTIRYQYETDNDHGDVYLSEVKDGSIRYLSTIANNDSLSGTCTLR